jgi:hypothetical protein
MGGTRTARRLGLTLFLLALAVARPSPALAGPKGLDALIRSLGLNGAGVERWLVALGVTRTNTAHERLMILSGEGAVVATLEGEGARVEVSPELADRLNQPGAGLILVHNHPSNSSLSWVDVLHLARPGLVAIVAIGHDGSVYAAARGPRFDPALVSYQVFTSARTTVDRGIKWYALSKGAADCSEKTRSYLPHVLLEALASLGLVDYRAKMSVDRQARYELRRALFENLVSNAARRIQAARPASR